MAYKSIFQDRQATTTKKSGYVSIFTKKQEREEKAKSLINEMVESGQATTTPIGSIPARDRTQPGKVGFKNVAREAWSIVSSPFKKIGEDYQKRKELRDDPEAQKKEFAARSLAGLEGPVYQQREATRVKQGISETNEEEAKKLIEGQEEQTEKLAKILTVPVRYTAGTLASAIVSYSLEKVDSDLKYDPRTDTEKLLINEGRVQRLTEQEDLYGMVARGVGIPASLIAMALIENPFLKSTGIGSIIKNRLKKMATKKFEGLAVKIGAEELAKLADDAIKVEQKAGRITEEQAIKATEEVSKMKKPKVKPPIKKIIKPKKTPIKYIPEEKPVDLRKKITTEKVTTEPAIPKRIENQAIEKGLIDNMRGIEDIDKVTFKNQAKLVGDIIDENPEKAIKIALGEELPTNGALPESVFIAVKNQALNKGDTDLLVKLATAEKGVARESTILGQRIKMLDEGMKDDAFKSINRLVKERKAKFETKGKKVTSAKKAEASKIKNKIKKPDKYDWDNFIKKIEC